MTHILAILPTILIGALFTENLPANQRADQIGPLKSCFEGIRWLDESLPVSRGEDVTATEKLIGNVYSCEPDIPFGQLPLEVQETVRAMTQGKYTGAKFMLTITLTHDPARWGRSVKTYIYTPIVFDEGINAETMDTNCWIFKRQDGILKLEAAKLD